MEFVKIIAICSVLTLLLAAGVRALLQRETPLLRLMATLGVILVALLALALGYPEVVQALFSSSSAMTR